MGKESPVEGIVQGNAQQTDVSQS